ncbi:MAG: hypothetical protein LRY21_00635 [Bacteroides graminisolvens]|nr:hypothetical protein [Bacteroides graminisolvens]
MKHFTCRNQLLAMIFS